MKTVYLCGGINALSDADAKDWREEAKRLLPAWVHIDPMRRDYRGKELELFKEIVTSDLDDIKHADTLLVNACRPSWGTAMEIHYARSLAKVIVAFGAGDRPSPWLMFHCSRLVPTLADAVEILG